MFYWSKSYEPLELCIYLLLYLIIFGLVNEASLCWIYAYVRSIKFTLTAILVHVRTWVKWVSLANVSDISTRCLMSCSKVTKPGESTLLMQEEEVAAGSLKVYGRLFSVCMGGGGGGGRGGWVAPSHVNECFFYKFERTIYWKKIFQSNKDSSAMCPIK